MLRLAPNLTPASATYSQDGASNQSSCFTRQRTKKGTHRFDALASWQGNRWVVCFCRFAPDRYGAWCSQGTACACCSGLGACPTSPLSCLHCAVDLFGILSAFLPLHGSANLCAEPLVASAERLIQNRARERFGATRQKERFSHCSLTDVLAWMYVSITFSSVPCASRMYSTASRAAPCPPREDVS